MLLFEFETRYGEGEPPQFSMSSAQTDASGDNDYGRAAIAWDRDFADLFSSSSVDDHKYERLLDDLRAHDLLGSLSTDTSLHEKTAKQIDNANSIAASTSLFFNDTFSATFMSNFEPCDVTTSNDTEAPLHPSDTSIINVHKIPPPGFASLNADSVLSQNGTSTAVCTNSANPSVIDLNWARGKHQYTETLQSTMTKDLVEEEQFDAFDESQILALRGLGLGLDGENGLDDAEKKRPIPRSLIQSPCGASPDFIGAASLPNTPKTASHHTFHVAHSASYTAANATYMQKKYKFMTSRDVNFVVQQQLKQIRMSDPYSDDYYFHNYTQKRLQNARMNASSGLPPPMDPSQLQKPSQDTSSDPPPAVLQRNGASPLIPLPSWQLKHVLTVNTQERQRAKKTRTWENENQVLGRNTKSSLYRPKEMLTCQSTRTHKDDADPSADTRTMLALSSEDWVKRRQISRGFECLLSLEDARHILDARHIDVQQFHVLDDSQLDPALVHLRSKTTALLLELANILGVTANDIVRVDGSTECVVQCVASQLFRIMSVRNGKQLLSRALPLLHPSARSLLLPHVMEYLFSPELVDRITANNALSGDERVCETLVILFLYHPSTSTGPMITRALERMLTDHTLQSFKSILLNRPRALLLHKILQRGNSEAMRKSMSESMKKRWSEAEKVFVRFASELNNRDKANEVV